MTATQYTQNATQPTYGTVYSDQGAVEVASIYLNTFTAHPLFESKKAHITFPPERTGTLMLAVHATEIRCKFNIWASATMDSKVEEERPSIAKVNKLLKKFDILSQYDPSVLDIHFPRYISTTKLYHWLIVLFVLVGCIRKLEI
jgi:hypothetical protein